MRQVAELPVGINGSFVTLRLRLNATVFSSYAPTVESEEEIEDNFYSQHDQILTAVPMLDKLILLWDFNACVGRD